MDMHKYDINADDTNKDVFECIFKALIFFYLHDIMTGYLFFQFRINFSELTQIVFHLGPSFASSNPKSWTGTLKSI